MQRRISSIGMACITLVVRNMLGEGVTLQR